MKFMRSLFILTMVMCMTTSCDKPNVLTDFSQQDSDEALFIDAQKKVDDRDWDSAISIINTQMSAAYRQNNVDVKELLAGAYAGRCGVNFVTLMQNLGASSSAKLMVFFMGMMKNQIVHPDDCDSAAAVIESIGTSAQRTADQNLFYTILGMAKTGAWLRIKADQDNSGEGDGLTDAGFKPCKAAQLPDVNVVKAIVGLGMVIDNISTVSSKLSASTVTDINNFQTNCKTALNIALTMQGKPTVAACKLSDPDFVDDYTDIFRLLIDDGTSYGIGSCANGLFIPCACP